MSSKFSKNTSNLSISTQEIFRSVDEVSSELSLPGVSNTIMNQTLSRKEKKLLIISKNPVCSLDKLNKYAEDLHELKAGELKKVLHDNFYNATVMKASLCVAESIFYGDSNSTGLGKNAKIRHWIKNLRQIGAESVSGYALLAGLNDADDVFVVKVPRDANDDDLQHELFIGLFCTNHLRSKIPNFSYIFGGFRCSPPVVGPKGEKIDIYCNYDFGDKNVNYILYEKITPNISMREYVKTCRGIDFLNKYMQVMYALREAHKSCEYTHYDLHHENVLIWDILKTPSAIPYETERGLEYLLTDQVATIIDYGRSYIKYKGASYGYYMEPSKGVSGKNSYPMHEA